MIRCSVVFLIFSIFPGLSLANQAAEGKPPLYVGVSVCAACHADQAALWQKSDHAKSMQSVQPGAVLGNFEDASFTQNGITTRFSRRGSDYFVHTDGPGGKKRDYRVAYTFGYFPLQQYLIELPGGRLQALGIAWDSRPAEANGQRWFHLYPDVRLRPGESVHWTGRDQNWNFMCASCHSTNLKKNFNLAKNQFSTTWSDVNVTCEACHGPGSEHANWANYKRQEASGMKGLVVDLRGDRKLVWSFATAKSRIAVASGHTDAARAEADSCFPCHARRQELGNPRPGRPFLDNYLPTLIENGVYHADGQIDGEDFEYGSFAQSRMYRAGVVCTNCHQSHTLKLKAEGNALCAQCHQSNYYDDSQHHHHPANSESARCVNCHMPSKTYMGVDVRRDHGFRLPNPAHASASGSPDVCNSCHSGQAAGWAANALKRWNGNRSQEIRNPAQAFSALWRGSPSAARSLSELAANTKQSGYLRASALAQMPPSKTADIQQAILQAIGDPDGIVRLGAAHALSEYVHEDQIQLGILRLLDDSLRAVRIEAARALAGVSESRLTSTQRSSYQSALRELLAAEQDGADRPESHVNLAQIQTQLGKPAAAKKELRIAIRLDPSFAPAYINLADLYRDLGRDADGEQYLLQARKLAPLDPTPLHALALLRIRQGKKSDAMSLLRLAYGLAPENTHYSYLLALALTETGATEEALSIIEKARQKQPDDASLRELQVSIEFRLGRTTDAARHAAELQAELLF